MDLEEIRRCLQRGAYSVTDHALLEAFKEGITVADMVRVMKTGKIIERHAERRRYLLYGQDPNGIPIHVVID